MNEKTIQKFTAEFSLGDLERTCPSVSRDMIGKNEEPKSGFTENKLLEAILIRTFRSSRC